MNDPLRPLPTWRRIVLWQIGGILLATVVLGVIAATQLTLSSEELTLRSWPVILFGNTFWIVSAGVFMMPITVAALFAWTRLARRFPELERGYLAMVLGLSALGVLISLVTGAFSNWEIALGQVGGGFWRETISVAGHVIIPVLVGLILPRICIPLLRPGAFLGERRAAAV